MQWSIRDSRCKPHEGDEPRRPKVLRHRSFVLGAALVALLRNSRCCRRYGRRTRRQNSTSQTSCRAPSASHWLGTDSLGRDIVSLLIVGGRNSIAVGIIAVGIGIGFGVALGLLASARRGWVEELVMRRADFTFAFPALLSAIMLTAVYGPGWSRRSLRSASSIFRYSHASHGRREVCGRASTCRARALGKGAWRITVEHVLPNIAAVLIVQATIQFAVAILAEAALSYLGLGTQPPQPSWGRMLNEAQQMMFQAPQLAVWPGVAIALGVLGLNLMGDGMRDLLDPRLVRRGNSPR